MIGPQMWVLSMPKDQRLPTTETGEPPYVDAVRSPGSIRVDTVHGELTVPRAMIAGNGRQPKATWEISESGAASVWAPWGARCGLRASPAACGGNPGIAGAAASAMGHGFCGAPPTWKFGGAGMGNGQVPSTQN
ncbi:hypothetical protein N656DRAFT_319474 [Canariomyces notabilis]|uniref:Uncharacterized protein n=1 Tax=Canariomyces notabilis TaxID=2074819 RepID=A0AAN6QJD5_9PEZI|nr:hypothetical protein N656DRAFT_319474 [Canariomyces arenarius]